MASILIGIHIAAVAGLAFYGLLGLFALWQYGRHRDDKSLLPLVSWDELPTATVQLPIFNEREVIGRLINATAALNYPADRLQIQVLDDSTDDTTHIAANAVAYYAAHGVNIIMHHRDNRRGFKAGALQEALDTASGEMIAIFDADFVPPQDFLLQTIPYLQVNSKLGAVQARWGHLNDQESPLTAAQAIALDKHFAIEQLMRHRANLFPKFNGAAGVWRKTAIRDVGGWQNDTVCEDLCLSTRAVLKGWQFHFAPDVVAPAELPATISAYKTQQSRWTTGATQCLVKYAPAIWRAGDQTKTARLYALLSMSAYMTNALLLVLLFVQLPLLIMGERPPAWLYPLSLLGLGQPILFILAQVALYKEWPRRLQHFPTLLLLAIGLAPSNSWAALKGLRHREVPFVRTPKGGGTSYHSSLTWMLGIELGWMVYCGISLLLALSLGNSGPILLLGSATIAFGYVSWLSAQEHHHTFRSLTKAAQSK